MNENKMNETKQIDYKDLADFLLDYLCLLQDLDDVIQILVGVSYDAEQLEELGFDRADINRILESRE